MLCHARSFESTRVKADIAAGNILPSVGDRAADARCGTEKTEVVARNAAVYFELVSSSVVNSGGGVTHGTTLDSGLCNVHQATTDGRSVLPPYGRRHFGPKVIAHGHTVLEDVCSSNSCGQAHVNLTRSDVVLGIEHYITLTTGFGFRF